MARPSSARSTSSRALCVLLVAAASSPGRRVFVANVPFGCSEADLGVAFRGVAGPLSAALSLEDGEAVRVALDRGDLRFGPPAGYRALGDARLAPLAEDEEAPAVAASSGRSPLSIPACCLALRCSLWCRLLLSLLSQPRNEM